MGMNGIIFGYMNGYGVHAELIYKLVFFQAPATAVPRTKFYLKYSPHPFSLYYLLSCLSLYHMTYFYNL